jgi:tetratricopeptide (TPR) repeat protein
MAAALKELNEELARVTAIVELFDKAKLLTTSGRFAEARGALAQLLPLTSALSILCWSAKAALGMGKTDQVMSLTLQVLRREKKNILGLSLRARCAFSDRNLHSRMPLDPMHVRLKLVHACDQWHSSRKSAFLTGSPPVNCVQTLKAHAMYLSEQYDDAIKLAREALRLDPDHQEAKACFKTAKTIKAAMQQATTAGQQRDFGTVKQVCTSVLNLGTVRVFRQEFTLEDAIGSHACSLEANIRVTNGIPLVSSLLLPVDTVNCVNTLKAFRKKHRCLQTCMHCVGTPFIG